MTQHKHNLNSEVLKWMNDGETGLSSRFMATFLCGVTPEKTNYPHDPDDFKRCVFLLDQVPDLRNKLVELKKAGPVWSKYVDHWEEMENLFREEFPKKEAPKLFNLMQKLQKEALS